MAGDLEDFLRRAAERRQAKAAQQQQQPAPQPRQRPQYSNHRTERITRPVEIEEVLTAEIVDDDSRSFHERMRRLDEAKKVAAKAEAEAAEVVRKVSGRRPRAAGGGAISLSGNPAADLRALLKTPGGICQAILLREILDRPEHRW